MGVFIELRAEDGFLSRGYLALPPAGRGPGIIVQQEIFGLNRQIRGICDARRRRLYNALMAGLG
jgi:carboxymethylenebutenolidase